MLSEHSALEVFQTAAAQIQSSFVLHATLRFALVADAGLAFAVELCRQHLRTQRYHRVAQSEVLRCVLGGVPRGLCAHPQAVVSLASISRGRVFGPANGVHAAVAEIQAHCTPRQGRSSGHRTKDIGDTSLPEIVAVVGILLATVTKNPANT